MRHFAVKRKKPFNLSCKDQSIFSGEFFKIVSITDVAEIKNMVFIDNISFRYFLWPFFEYSFPYGIEWKSLGKALVRLIWRIHKVRVIKKPVLYVTDNWTGGYFHWITEVLPRALHLRSVSGISDVLIPTGHICEKYAQDSLNYLGLNYCGIPGGMPYLIKESICGARVRSTGNYYIPDVQKLRDLLRRNIDKVRNKASQDLPVDGERVWISRSGSQKRVIENEDELLPLLRKFDFQVVRLEELSFSEQMIICSRASIIAGLHGAGLANMVFMQAGGKVLEVRIKGDNLNNCFFSLASALDLDYYYLQGDSMRTSQSRQCTSVQVDVRTLEATIKHILRVDSHEY